MARTLVKMRRCVHFLRIYSQNWSNCYGGVIIRYLLLTSVITLTQCVANYDNGRD